MPTQGVSHADFARTPDDPPHPEAQPWMLELDALLEHVSFLAEHRKQVPTTRVAPEIPAGMFVEG